MNTSQHPTVRRLARAEGRLAYTDQGSGPLVVAAPGMGDLRATYDDVVPHLLAAAQRPDLVRGLVLLDGFLREPSSPAKLRAMRVLYRLALARPWGAAFWASFYGSLNKGRTPARLAAHQAAIRANLSEPGRLRSFRDLTLQLDHRVVEPRVAQVEAPVLAVYGALDPDYADPAAEAAWAEQALGAT